MNATKVWMDRKSPGQGKGTEFVKKFRGFRIVKYRCMRYACPDLKLVGYTTAKGVERAIDRKIKENKRRYKYFLSFAP